MDIYKGNVRLNGRLDQVVLKKNMTAAEIVVLRGVHGHDAVVDIEKTGQNRNSYSDEYNRLCAIYGDTTCEEVWPGSHKVLPENIDDIHLEGGEPTSYTVVGSNFKNQSVKVKETLLQNQKAKGGLPYRPPTAA